MRVRDRYTQSGTESEWLWEDNTALEFYHREHESLSASYTMRKVVPVRTVIDPDVQYDATTFHNEVLIYLADPDGWAQFYSFVDAPKGPAKVIHLASPTTLRTNGCKDGRLSCATLGGTEIWLNADRWIHGAPASRLSLDAYRQYMVSHEMGHSLGHDHVKCPGSGPVPVMVQQTLGIGACTPNTKLTKYDLQSKQ